jgi:PE-PPE domain-containing protein
MKKSLLVAAAATASVLLTAPAAGAMTYTLESTDFDGVLGIVMNVTQQQLGGTLCPCTKIPYPADIVSNAQGVAALASAPLKAGDIVLGYSLGSVVISAYLNSHTPPPGVEFILLGDTSNPNGLLAATGLLPLFGGGIPPSPRAPRPRSHPTPNPVTIIGRQYDGWADFPNNILAPGYLLAVLNAMVGASTIHNDYTEASLLNNPANVTWTQGNITYELVPTQNLPINQGWRNIGLGSLADALDAMQRPMIDVAYTNRPNPTAAQLAASTSEQAKVPSPVQIPGPPEPVATLNPPPTASVLASSTNRTPTPAPAKATTNLVTSASTVGDLTPAPRHSGVSAVGDLTPAPRHDGVSSVEPGSEVESPRRGSDAEATKPLTTKPAEAAVSAPSKPSPLHHSTSS